MNSSSNHGNAQKGKVQTVDGLLDPDQLGFTLPHEHFLLDCTVDFMEPADSRYREVAHQPVSFENLSWIRSHIWSSYDNLTLTDVSMALHDALLFKKAGGRTIVDVTPNNVGRDPETLLRISREANIHIIMGTAYYREASYRPIYDMESRTERDIADEFVRDVTEGVDGTGIHAGIIGEVACSWPLTANERKVLRASAMAQQQTGAAVSVHPGFYDEAPLQIIDILRDAGADISRVIMCHMGETVKSHSARFRLSETGCCLEWDRFGSDGEYPFYSLGSPNGVPDIPNDPQRLNQIIQLIGEGHVHQILISHDLFMKIELTHFGGGGYAHIPNNVLPLMREKRISEEFIDAITVENPKRLLTIV
jgi:phosphotriesterase-related protein